MTRFTDFPPMDQPEHRLGILAALPEDAIVATARVAARDQDMAWLEPMVRGGLLDADDVRTASGKPAVSQALAWAERAEAFTAFVQNIAFENIQHDALLGALADPIPVLVHRPREDARSLFGYAIGRTVPVFKQIEETHPDSTGMEFPLHKGMAALLCGAIAMDLPDAVRAIVRDFPSSASLQFPLTKFGPAFSQSASSAIGAGKPAKGKINAIGLAVRLSRTECLDLLLESDPSAMDSLGQRQMGSGEARLTVCNMPEFFTPHCTPAMWGKVTERVYDQTNLWNKPVAPGEEEPPRIEDVLTSHEPVVLLRGPANKPMAPYIEAMAQVGVYDFSPEHMLPVAVSTGHASLVTNLVDKVSDWSLVEDLFLPPNSPIAQAARNAMDERDPDRAAEYEAAVLALLKGAMAHGKQAGFHHRPEDDFPQSSVSSMEPFYSVAEAGFNSVVILYLDQGFDLNQKCPPDEGIDDPDTVLEQLTRAQPAAAAVVRSYLARNKAMGLLDEMDENKNVSAKP